MGAQIRVKHLEAFGDSQLVVSQVQGAFWVLHHSITPYHTVVIQTEENFASFFIEHICCSKNTHVDSVASLAASLALALGLTERVLVYAHDLCRPKLFPDEDPTPALDCYEKEPLEIFTSLELKDWRFLIVNYILFGKLPEDPKEASTIKRKSSKYYYY